MPKLKTHKGTAKRMKVSGSGKLLRRRAFGHHHLAGKSEGRKRVISTDAVVSGGNAKNIKRALGI